MRRIVAVVGASKARQSAEAVDRALAVLRRDHDVPVTTVDGPDDVRDAVDGADRVVVLGGDGSVHAFVQVLADLDLTGAASGPEVALVPLGTGNDLARGVGIPLDVEEAARLAVHGHPRRLALLEDEDGGIVVNAVHIGVGASAARTAERAQVTKSVLAGAAYSVAAVVAGVRSRGWHLRVTVDGRLLHDGTEPVLMVATGLGHTIGGGAPLAPAADPFSGVAQVTVSRSTGWLARFGYAAALRQGRHHHRRDVTSARAHDSVQVEALRGEAVDVDADGEVDGPHSGRTWQVRHDAWRLVVPD